MGPIALFDKSFLQSLSEDESVWFDYFFHPNICPIFFAETLGDLHKPTDKSGRTGLDHIVALAKKTPQMQGGPNCHHLQLCIGELLGHPVPMTGQIVLSGGRHRQTATGEQAITFDHFPEAEAFHRWKNQEFEAVEKIASAKWRRMLDEIDLKKIRTELNKIGINGKTFKTFEQIHAEARSIVNSYSNPVERISVIFDTLGIPIEYRNEIFNRWKNLNYPPLPKISPYSSYIFHVEIFFQIAIASNHISADRSSNKIDVAYLYYLPFCNIFVSSDHLHEKCSNIFLREDQMFISGITLKNELKRIDEHYKNLPENVRRKGLNHFAHFPPGSEDDLLPSIWKSFLPKAKEKSISSEPRELNKDADLIKKIQSIKNSIEIPISEKIRLNPSNESVILERSIQKKKGSWWLLPADLKDAPKNSQ